MFACRGGTLASRARGGVLTWGGGGDGGADREFVAVGNEGVQSVIPTFDGLEDDGLLVDIVGLLPLLLLRRNQGNGVGNLLIQLVELRVHLQRRCVFEKVEGK